MILFFLLLFLLTYTDFLSARLLFKIFAGVERTSELNFLIIHPAHQLCRIGIHRTIIVRIDFGTPVTILCNICHKFVSIHAPV